MPDINDPNLSGAFGSGSITNSGGSVNYDAPSNQINMGNQIDMGGDIGSWDSFDFSISNDVLSANFNSGGTVNDVANQIGQGSVNDPAKADSGGWMEKLTSKLSSAFEGKEGDKMVRSGDAQIAIW